MGLEAHFPSLNLPRFLWRKVAQEKLAGYIFFNFYWPICLDLNYILTLSTVVKGMVGPHLKTQLKFTGIKFCFYFHSQDNNQPSPKDRSRQWLFLTENFSPPICYSNYMSTLSIFPSNHSSILQFICPYIYKEIYISSIKYILSINKYIYIIYINKSIVCHILS